MVLGDKMIVVYHNYIDSVIHTTKECDMKRLYFQRCPLNRSVTQVMHLYPAVLL